MIFHAILMGVAVEGINFYGIGELRLFLCNMGNILSFNYASGIAFCFFCLTLPFIWYFNNNKDQYIKEGRKRKNSDIEMYRQIND